MPDLDDLDAVFENMATPEPATQSVRKKSILDALRELGEGATGAITEVDLHTIKQAVKYMTHLESVAAGSRDVTNLLNRAKVPNKKDGIPILLVDRVEAALAAAQVYTPDPQREALVGSLREEVDRLVPVFKTARALRDLGYDGTFMGEFVAPLRTAVAEAEKGGQR